MAVIKKNLAQSVVVHVLHSNNRKLNYRYLIFISGKTKVSKVWIWTNLEKVFPIVICFADNQVWFLSYYLQNNHWHYHKRVQFRPHNRTLSIFNFNGYNIPTQRNKSSQEGFIKKWSYEADVLPMIKIRAGQFTPSHY